MCCRDRFGVKPFFYAWKDGALVFASELKALFQYPGLEPRLGRQGLCEVLGIGPARTAGAGVFEGVREYVAQHFQQPCQLRFFQRSGRSPAHIQGAYAPPPEQFTRFRDFPLQTL